MVIPIRIGYSIDVNNHESIEQLKELEDQKFISVSQKKYFECSKCGNQVAIIDNSENFGYCYICKKRQNTSKFFVEAEIEVINYDKIIKAVNEIFKKFNLEFKFDKFSICWHITLNNKITPVMISEISDSSYLLANSENELTMFIVLDMEQQSYLINQMNSSQFISLTEILKNPQKIFDSIKNNTLSFDQNYSIELEEKFDTMLNTIDGYQFEDFCNEFLESIKNKSKELSSFYDYLTKYQLTIINSKIIKLGGPGNPDFYIINLLNYLQSGLTPDKFGEAKRYDGSSRFTIEKFAKAILQGNNNDTLFLVTTKDIQIEVWKSVIKNMNNKKFKYVLLDKSLLLILIKCLKIEYLIDKFLQH